MTPAEELGILVGGVRLRLIGNRGHDHGNLINYEWVLSEDDGSNCPYFSTVCDTHTNTCFWLSNMEKIETPAISVKIKTLDENNKMIETSVERTQMQQNAIDTFTTMLERAEKYRATGSSDSDSFYSGYGICDNIGRCKPTDASESRMSNVKDNIIRVVPSYSGNYHYPVRHPNPPTGATEHESAAEAWSSFSNRWDGAYGAERIIQLKELIDHVTNKWLEGDKYCYDMTPAERVGITELTLVMRTNDNTLWKLSKDDGSSDPYFTPLGGSQGDRQAIDLRYIRVMPNDNGPKLSVSAFIAKLKRNEAKRLQLEEKARLLRVEIDKLKNEEGLLDYYMGQQHEVKRISKL